MTNDQALSVGRTWPWLLIPVAGAAWVLLAPLLFFFAPQPVVTVSQCKEAAAEYSTRDFSGIYGWDDARRWNAGVARCAEIGVEVRRAR